MKKLKLIINAELPISEDDLKAVQELGTQTFADSVGILIEKELDDLKITRVELIEE